MTKHESSGEMERRFAIPATGIAVASGAALLAGSLSGPIGALVATGVGALSGVFLEIASQRNHDRSGRKETTVSER